MIEHFLPGSPYTEELCRYLVDYCDVTIMTNRTYHGNSQIAWTCKPVLNIPYCKSKVKSLLCIIWGWIMIIYELLSGKYDVVHVQTFKFLGIERIIYELFSHNKILVHTVHNVLPHERKSGDVVRYQKFYSKCDALIVHNTYCKDLLIENYNITPEKITVVPHGAYWKPGCMDFPKEHKKINFLQLGMIRKYKGVDILIKAVAKIPKDKRNYMHFTIAGSQDQGQDSTDYIGTIKKLDIEDCITFIPERIPDEEMDTYYNQADACIFPYLEIYGSGALLMAYGYAKPVIASDIPAFIEETDNGMTGLLFKSEDSDDLARKLIQFTEINQERVNGIRKYIQKLVEDKYNWSKSAESTARVYGDVNKKDGLL